MAQRELRVDVSGAGALSGSGTVESLRVSLSGAGSVAATATTSAEVNVSGVGMAVAACAPPVQPGG